MYFKIYSGYLKAHDLHTCILDLDNTSILLLSVKAERIASVFSEICTLCKAIQKARLGVL